MRHISAKNTIIQTSVSMSDKSNNETIRLYTTLLRSTFSYFRYLKVCFPNTLKTSSLCHFTTIPNLHALIIKLYHCTPCTLISIIPLHLSIHSPHHEPHHHSADNQFHESPRFANIAHIEGLHDKIPRAPYLTERRERIRKAPPPLDRNNATSPSDVLITYYTRELSSRAGGPLTIIVERNEKKEKYARTRCLSSGERKCCTRGA